MMHTRQAAIRNTKSGIVRCSRADQCGRTSQRNPARQPGVGILERLTCSFGATRVDTFFDRLHLHLSTDRFLASRRRDPAWEAACDYAALTLSRLESQLSASDLAAPLPARVPAVSCSLIAALVRRRDTTSELPAPIVAPGYLAERVAPVRVTRNARSHARRFVRPRLRAANGGQR